MRGVSFTNQGTGAVLLLTALALAGCEGSGSTRRYTGTVNHPGGPVATETHRPTGIRGDFAEGSDSGARTAAVRVNRFAWRAALDSVSFMPLATSDPYGGAISTDWYISRRNADERLKVNVLVGGPELRADTVKVTVFRQERKGGRDWVNAPVDVTTAQNLENVILQRARELRQQAGN
jgi:hypothetical protein